MIIRTAALASVLTLGDNALVGGYCVTRGYSEPPRTHRRLVNEAPRVDGGYEHARSLSKERITLPVLIVGSSIADARAKHHALLDAVEVDQWVLDVLGDSTTVLWVCDAADTEPAQLFSQGLQRLVTLSIPVQPAAGY